MNLKNFFDQFNLEPREAQKEAIEKIERNWKDKKYFILDAPVGVGKSFIGLAAIQEAGNGFLLTSTKQLQEQYNTGPGDCTDLRGRSNYECYVNASMNCGNAPCTTFKPLGKRCIAIGVCPYVNQRKAAMASQTMLTNYAYFLFAKLCGPLSAHNGDPTPRSVLVCDEAHALEDHLVSFAEVILDSAKLCEETDTTISFNLQKDRIDEEIRSAHEAIKRTLISIDEELQQLFIANGIFKNEDQKKLPKEALSKAKYLSTKKGRIDRLEKKLGIYYNTKNTIEWIVDHDFKEDRIKLIPLEAKGLFQEFCESTAEKFIFMSATMGSPEEFARELGLDFKDCCLIKCKTDFPAENAPIVPLSAARMNYKEIDKSLPKIKEAIATILEHHPNDKGIIHTANYKIANYLRDTLNESRLLCRSEGRFAMTNEELLERHAKSTSPSVLMSPSMGTGISLDDELARFQVIVKLPFMSLADERVKQKLKRRGSWYTNKMWMEVMQSSGRAIRSKDDAAITYVLDSAFWYFYDEMEDKLPEWFKDRIQRKGK